MSFRDVRKRCRCRAGKSSNRRGWIASTGLVRSGLGSKGKSCHWFGVFGEAVLSVSQSRRGTASPKTPKQWHIQRGRAGPPSPFRETPGLRPMPWHQPSDDSAHSDSITLGHIALPTEQLNVIVSITPTFGVWNDMVVLKVLIGRTLGAFAAVALPDSLAHIAWNVA